MTISLIERQEHRFGHVYLQRTERSDPSPQSIRRRLDVLTLVANQPLEDVKKQMGPSIEWRARTMASRFSCKVGPSISQSSPESCGNLVPRKNCALFVEICELRSVIGNEHGEQACWFGRAGVLADEM